MAHTCGKHEHGLYWNPERSKGWSKFLTQVAQSELGVEGSELCRKLIEEEGEFFTCNLEEGGMTLPEAVEEWEAVNEEADPEDLAGFFESVSGWGEMLGAVTAGYLKWSKEDQVRYKASLLEALKQAVEYGVDH